MAAFPLKIAPKHDTKICYPSIAAVTAEMGGFLFLSLIHICMETLVRICEALNCGILDVIELEQDEEVEILN